MTQAGVFYFSEQSRGGRRKSTRAKWKINSNTQMRKLLIYSHSNESNLSTSGRLSTGKFPTSGEQQRAVKRQVFLQEYCSNISLVLLQNFLISFLNFAKTIFSQLGYATQTILAAAVQERRAVDNDNVKHIQVSGAGAPEKEVVKDCHLRRVHEKEKKK